MSDNIIKVLLVEDSPSDAGLTLRCLHECGIYNTTHVETLKEAKEILQINGQGQMDLVLLDLSLPDSNGLETLSALRSVNLTVPIVVLTGLDDTEVALEAIKLEAQDYQCKDNLSETTLRSCIKNLAGAASC